MSTLKDQQANLIAFSNYNHGSIPTESMVLVTLRGSATEGFLRVGLPEEGKGAVDTAIYLLDMLKPSNPEGVVILVYTEHDKDRYFDLIAALIALSLGIGFKVADTLLVRENEWQNYFEDETHPIAEVEHAPIAAEMIARGHALKTGNESDVPKVSDDREFYLKVETYLREVPPIPDVWDMEDSTYRMARDEWDRALVNDFGPPDAAATRLVAYFQRKAIRDRLMADVLTLSDDKGIWSAALAGEIYSANRPRVRRAISLLTNLASRSTVEHQPPLLAVIGWCHWIIGQGTAAMEFFDRAVELDPHLRIALLMRELIGTGQLPQCAMTPPTE